MPIVEVAGRNVYYELHTRDAAKGDVPLLLIGGTGGSCRGWIPLQVPEFSKTRPTLIFNFRGVMDSDDPGGSFTTGDLAEDTSGLLDALDIERADVLGAFMGGMTAQELALRHPHRVRNLILLGSYARPDAKRRFVLEDWATLARANISHEVLMRTRLTWTVEDATLEQTDLIESMLAFYKKEGPPVPNDLFARQCDACVAHDTLDRLDKIVQPTLVICGRHDRLTPPSLHHELAEGIPNSRLVVIQYGAHLVMVESAERFNQVVLQFLESEEH